MEFVNLLYSLSCFFYRLMRDENIEYFCLFSIFEMLHEYGFTFYNELCPGYGGKNPKNKCRSPLVIIRQSSS